jgi:small-conductance mechanosensitive channel
MLLKDLPENKVPARSCQVEPPSTDLSNPAPAVNVKNFGPYAIDFEIGFWAGNILDADDIKSELIIHINTECSKAGIIIPVPQQEIHVRSMPEEKK